MKIRSYCVVSIILLLIFSYCSKSDNNSEVKDDGISTNDSSIEIKIRGMFKGMAFKDVTTRITDNCWETGDAIGVYMKKSSTDSAQFFLENNIKYTAVGNSDLFTTTQKIYFPKNNQKVDFIAYYPYLIKLSDMKYPIDVSKLNINNDPEFMYSDNAKNCSSKNNEIKLEFHPQLVKLTIQIFDNYDRKLLNFDENQIMIKASHLHSKANFNLSTGLFELFSGEDYISDITFKNYTDKAEALILPVDNLEDISFEVKINDKTHTLPLLDAVYCGGDIVNSFDQAHEYKFSIYLTGSEIDEGISATILDRKKIIVNDIILPEDPVTDEELENKDDTGNSNSGDAEGGGEDDIADEEQGDKDNTPENPPTKVGEGTKENPYSIAQILEGVNEKKDNIWVEGYYKPITHFKDAFQIEMPATTDKNLAIADFPEVESSEFTIPIVLKDLLSSSYLDALNLKSNDHLGKKLLILGDVNQWNNGSAHIESRISIITLHQVFLDDVEL